MLEIQEEEKLIFFQGKTNLSPILVDLNNDSFSDLVVGNKNGTLLYYKNEGTNENPKFSLVENSIKAEFQDDIDVDVKNKVIDVGDFSAPTFGDFDGDSDFDLVVGNKEGNLWYFENIGNLNAPLFRFVTDRFFNIKSVGGYSTPHAIDFNQNRLYDLIVGSRKGDINIYFNNGNLTTANFSIPVTSYNTNSYHNTTPFAIDWDDDGNIDIISGQKQGQLLFFKNFSNNTNPVFHDPEELFHDLDVGGNSSFTMYRSNFGNIGLGILGHRGSNLYSFDVREYNQEKVLWSRSVNITNRYELLNTAKKNYFAFGDVDKNGYKDILIGNESTLKLFLVMGKNKNDHFIVEESPYHFFDRFFFKNITPDFVDLNGDGLLDIVIGEEKGDLYFFENKGDNKELNWQLTKSSLEDIDAGPNPKIRFFDHDGDGDFDLFITNDTGKIKYFKNVGNKKEFSFELSSLQLDLNNLEKKLKVSSISFYDWNKNKMESMFIGTFDNRIFILPNKKINEVKFNIRNNNYFYDLLPYEFELWKKNREDKKTDLFQFITDIDNDGLPEVVMSNSEGDILLFSAEKRHKIRESVLIEKFARPATKKKKKKKKIINAAEEVQEIKIILENKKIEKLVIDKYRFKKPKVLLEANMKAITQIPSFADIDNDGDLDLLIGSKYGELSILINNGNKKAHQFNGVQFSYDTKKLNISPVFVDIDNDRDFDILFGDSKGSIYFLKNTGNLFEYEFIKKPKKIVDQNFRANTTIATFNSKPPFEFLVGNLYGQMNILKQYTKDENQFMLRFQENLFLNENIGINIHLDVKDINLDGVKEIIIGNGTGNLRIYQKREENDKILWKRNNEFVPKYNFSKGVYPVFADLNNDGLLDLIVGTSNQEILYFENNSEIKYVSENQ